MGNNVPHGESAESVRTNLAYFIVFLGLPAIIITYWFFGTNTATQLVPVVSGMIGIVLGYFYGTKGIERIEKTADKATGMADKAEKEKEKAEKEKEKDEKEKDSYCI